MNTQNIDRNFQYATKMEHYGGGLYKFMFDKVKVHETIGMYRKYRDHNINNMGTTWALGLYVAKHTETEDVLLIWKDGIGGFGCHIISKGPKHKDITGEELVVYVDSNNDVWARPRDMFYEYMEDKGRYRFEIIDNSDSLEI
jgi:hypothetical protein